MATDTPSATDLVPIGEAVRMTGLSASTLRNYGDQGRLTVYRTPSGQRRFLRTEVETLLTPPNRRDAA
jgi:DNA-binding transcriptional MerR regulator